MSLPGTTIYRLKIISAEAPDGRSSEDRPQLSGNDEPNPAGKQPIGPVLVRAMTMLTLLPAKPPGVTARQLRDALANRHDGFDVVTRTIERNLSDLSGYFPITRDEDVEPHRWYWMPGANLNLQHLAQRLAAAGDRSPPSASAPALSWRPAEDFARALKVPPGDVIDDIQSGVLNGVLLQGRWYVLDLVALDVADKKNPERARLRVASHRVGNRLTAGRDVLDIALTYDADAISDAISPLMTNQGADASGMDPGKARGHDF